MYVKGIPNVRVFKAICILLVFEFVLMYFFVKNDHIGASTQDIVYSFTHIWHGRVGLCFVSFTSAICFALACSGSCVVL